MKFNWLNIFEGWRNHLVPPHEIKRLIQETSEERLEICKDCDSNSKNAHKRGPARCMECGCPLFAKTKCLSCFCDLNKWEAVLTEQQDEELMKENDDTG